ncbi:TetR/AcrR family transcriptional regulator [Paraburkholderia kururiensis]|uniref:TetR/AcrR family transcriptional regulator n=1 Tax=Paraburkholderia kururiensis TaxID=984307 RepID=UPI0018F3681C|nr:TetR/AcrR family transcriptional regulator [Paraburkholderia kururiensis]
METPTVRDQVLQHAQSLLMTRGYNGFSYRDLADLVGVKTSSIHYYFPTKEDLVLEAVNVYSLEVLSALRGIDEALPPEKKLERYAKQFGLVMGNGDQICLCGMLAADIESLPDNVRQAVQAFFKTNEAWLAGVLAEGEARGTLRVNGKVESAARALYASFQGSVLASRLFHSKARLDDVVNAVKIA